MTKSPLPIWLLWAPWILLGSLAYWTLALGLGAMSLGALEVSRVREEPTVASGCFRPAPRNRQPIIVDTRAGGAMSAMYWSDHGDPPVGRTAF